MRQRSKKCAVPLNFLRRSRLRVEDNKRRGGETVTRGRSKDLKTAQTPEFIQLNHPEEGSNRMVTLMLLQWFTQLLLIQNGAEVRLENKAVVRDGLVCLTPNEAVVQASSDKVVHDMVTSIK